MLVIFLVCCLNLVISFFNARACGMCWVETKALGGFARVLTWCGAIQAVIGFSMVIVFAEAGLASLVSPVGGALARHMISLWYLAAIVPAIGTGLIITVHSWIEAYKKRDIGTISTAAYNSIAQFHNMSQAGSGISSALGDVGDLITSSDDDSGLVVFAIFGAAIALFTGAIVTYLIIHSYKGSITLGELSDEATS